MLNQEHRHIGEVVADVPGQLRPEDETKLYELAQQTRGPILEIGTYRGRSTTIMALGAKAGNGAMLVSVDVDPNAQKAARRWLRKHEVEHRVVLVRGTAAAALRVLRGFTPNLVFIDGDHSAPGVTRDLEALRDVVPAGGLLLFHDWADERNDDPGIQHIGVKDGIAASWVAAQCDFLGEYGACGLYRRREGSDPEVPVLDAVWRDSARMQYLQRVRWPAGRLARRVLGR